jgi:hypothetical protein
MSNDKKLFEEYGVVSKSPTELIEEFAVQMMVQHQIIVTEINFNEQNAIDKMSLMFKPKERIKTDTELDPKISRVHTSAGRIELGVKESK